MSPACMTAQPASAAAPSRHQGAIERIQQAGRSTRTNQRRRASGNANHSRPNKQVTKAVISPAGKALVT